MVIVWSVFHWLNYFNKMVNSVLVHKQWWVEGNEEMDGTAKKSMIVLGVPRLHLMSGGIGFSSSDAPEIGNKQRNNKKWKTTPVGSNWLTAQMFLGLRCVSQIPTSADLLIILIVVWAADNHSGIASGIIREHPGQVSSSLLGHYYSKQISFHIFTFVFIDRVH